jgi:hypothetical protein
VILKHKTNFKPRDLFYFHFKALGKLRVSACLKGRGHYNGEKNTGEQYDLRGFYCAYTLLISKFADVEEVFFLLRRYVGGKTCYVEQKHIAFPYTT